MRPSERDQILRMDFCMLITQFRPRQIVYVDEVGIQLKSPHVSTSSSGVKVQLT